MNTYKLRIIPLGGVTDVTKNMYVYELYEGENLKDILIIDCGIGFPKEKELGVDFVIPDISYLRDKTSFIRAVLLTHGHEDHTSALPFHYQKLGMPPVFSSKLTSAFVENKFKEFSHPLKVNNIQYRKDYQFGKFTVRFIHTTHSIPDATHILVKTPVGSFYHGTDFKFDLTPPLGEPPDFYEIIKAGNEGVLCLLSDCLGSEREGLTLSESIVGQTFEDEMRKTKGKFIMTTFSSNISRIRQCVDASIKFNRKIVFLGRSMRENTRIASEIGYLPIPGSLVAKEEDVSRLPPNKVCLIVAGSQGQYDSALGKLARDQNRNIKIRKGDKVIISSDPIPGNEDEVNALIEGLSLRGAEVVYTDIQDQLHTSGHGNKEDLKFLMRFTNPKFFIPIGGTYRHQRQYQKIAAELGYKEENVFLLDEGDNLLFTADKKAHKGEQIQMKTIFVDANGIGDVGSVVLRERKTLASEGVVMMLIVLDAQGRLLTRPRITSKGFVFEAMEKQLFERSVRLVERLFKPKKDSFHDLTSLKKEMAGSLEELFFKEKGRSPLITVEIIQV